MASPWKRQSTNAQYYELHGPTAHADHETEGFTYSHHRGESCSLGDRHDLVHGQARRIVYSLPQPTNASADIWSAHYEEEVRPLAHTSSMLVAHMPRPCNRGSGKRKPFLAFGCEELPLNRGGLPAQHHESMSRQCLAESIPAARGKLRSIDAPEL